MNRHKHTHSNPKQSSSTKSLVHIIISLIVIYVFHFYYSIYSTITENKRIDKALFKGAMFFLLGATLAYMLILYELIKDKKALFYFNVYKMIPICLLFTISGLVLFISSLRYIKEYSIIDRSMMVVMYIILQIGAIDDIDNITLNFVHMTIQSSIFLIGVFIKQKGFVYL